MRQACNAEKSGDWGKFLGNGKLSRWASVKVREWTADRALRRRFCRRARNSGASCHIVVCALIATDTRLKTTSGLFRARMRHVVDSTIGRHRKEFWSYKTARTAKKQKCFERTRRQTESKLLANKQKDCDSPVNVVAQGLSRE